MNRTKSKVDATPRPGSINQAWMNPACCDDLVTVVVPTYNRAKTILRTLESVTAQSYRPLELVVVDDGSTDATRQIIRNWIEPQSLNSINLRLIRQEHAGAQVARNLGLSQSTGSFLQFLDSDDWLHADKISLHVALLKKYPQADVATCNFAEIAGGHTFLGKLNGERVLILPDDYYRVRWGTPVVLYRREATIRIGPWDESLTIRQDLEYHVRMACMGLTAVHSPASLAYAEKDHKLPRISAVPTIESLNGYLWAISSAQRTLHLKRLTNDSGRNLLAIHFYKCARCAFRHGEVDLGRKAIQEALLLRPGLLCALPIRFLAALETLIGGSSAERMFSLCPKSITRLSRYRASRS